jgi:hypothetical protein
MMMMILSSTLAERGASEASGQFFVFTCTAHCGFFRHIMSLLPELDIFRAAVNCDVPLQRNQNSF